MQLLVDKDCIDTVRCVDIHHYSPPQEKEVIPEEPQMDTDDITHITKDLVLSKKGTRVIMSVEDYSKEKQVSQKEESVKPKIMEQIRICETCPTTADSLQSILSSPFYLLFSESSVFIQLMRSLVLKQSLARAEYNQIPALILPISSTTCYLFLEEGRISGMEEEDCLALLNAGSTDLFAFWNHSLESKFKSVIINRHRSKGKGYGTLPWRSCQYLLSAQTISVFNTTRSFG